MGGSPYWYIVPHEDPKAALKKLRTREFSAGRYHPAVQRLKFPITKNSPAPGAQHKSIKEAVTASEPEGTRSILDIDRISDKPALLAATPLTDDQLMDCFETKKPTARDVEGLARMKLFSKIPRGQAVYFPLYQGDEPTELMFAGYSCD
jgi:hypothetical protein